MFMQIPFQGSSRADRRHLRTWKERSRSWNTSNSEAKYFYMKDQRPELRWLTCDFYRPWGIALCKGTPFDLEVCLSRRGVSKSINDSHLRTVAVGEKDMSVLQPDMYRRQPR